MRILFLGQSECPGINGLNTYLSWTLCFHSAKEVKKLYIRVLLWIGAFFPKSFIDRKLTWKSGWTKKSSCSFGLSNECNETVENKTSSYDK